MKEKGELLMYFRVDIFNHLGTKVKELVVKADRKSACNLEALRWINGNLHHPEKCTYTIN